jgi:hypothetical protein
VSATVEARRSRLHMDRVHVSGVEPLRLLVIGDRPTVLGAGESLATALAGAVCYGTVRGADLDVLTDLTPVLGAVRGAFDSWRLWRYDAVVVLVDARPGRIRAASRRHLRRLVREVAADTTVATRVVVGGLEATRGPAPLRPLGAVEAVAARDERIRVVGLPAAEDLPGPQRVASWCRLLSDCLRETLPAAGGVVPAAALRDRPDDEAERQHAVDDLGVVRAASDPRLDELVELARTVLGTASAEINVLDHDRQVKVAVAGGVPGLTPRSVSFCDRTIRRAGPLVVGDAAADPEFAGNPLVTDAAVPIRFYAGHPIESVDGYRIGTLCVYDPEPRDPATLNLGLLRDLALLAQAELTGRDVVPRDEQSIRSEAR